jgi:hypothetical protein
MQSSAGENMSSVTDHYDLHLAPVYSWMAGGIADAVARGQKELADIGLLESGARYAVDLGAGFGMHAIPLSRNGSNVLAIDSSAFLLDELKDYAGDTPVETVKDDLLNFASHLSGEPDVVLCMGDTLTHLSGMSSVTALISSVREHLSQGGRFVITFRDYTRALEGTNRFIPVKSDETRISTCFLEYAVDTVRVHDILHERKEGTWVMRVSTYQKLRLEPVRIKQQLERCGFEVSMGAGTSGMVRIIAFKD